MPSPTCTALGLLLISNDVTLKEDRVGTLFPHNLKPSLHPLSHEMQRSRNRVVSTSRLARLGKSLPSALLAAKPATLHDYVSKTLKPHFRGRFVGTAASTEEIIRIATKGAKTSYIFSQWLQSTIARHLSQYMTFEYHLWRVIENILMFISMDLTSGNSFLTLSMFISKTSNVFQRLGCLKHLK